MVVHHLVGKGLSRTNTEANMVFVKVRTVSFAVVHFENLGIRTLRLIPVVWDPLALSHRLRVISLALLILRSLGLI